MTKVTYEEKIKLLEAYKALPRGVNDSMIITAIIADVVKANSKGVRTASEPTENALYNKCMGIYREFLKSRNSHLDMTGRNAKNNSEAMRSIISYMVSFARSNGRPSDDEAVINGFKFLFNNWDKLNDYHRNRILLPDISSKIAEILPMIRNGYDQKSTAKNELDSLKHRLTNK